MLCQKLKEFRDRCNFSQQMVAECLNIDRSTYSYYESGRTEPSIDNLKKIARLFGVGVNELLEVSDDKEAAPVGILRDSGIDDPNSPLKEYETEDSVKLDKRIGSKVGDLSREEQRLIMRFRMLTDNQRRDIMHAMSLSLFDHGSGDPRKNNF